MISCEKEILDILKNIKVIAFDMDGVLRIGNNPISGAENIFKIIKDLNKESIIITNECRYTSNTIREDLLEMGIDIINTPIITASDRIYDYLKNKSECHKDKNISLGIIGEKGLYDTILPLTNVKNR